MKIALCLSAYALYSSIAGVRLDTAMLGQASLPGNSAAPQSATAPDLMPTPGRILIITPSKPLPLGEETALAVTLKGPAPRVISTNQSMVNAGVSSPAIQDTYAEAALERNGDGQTYIKIVPQRPGKLKIDVDVFFSDGGYDRASTIVDVFAEKPPIKLDSEFDLFGVSRLSLDLSEQGRRRSLRIAATYAGVREPLSIDPDHVQFKVTMSKEVPPITFDPKTLEINALRTGNALIETRYGGLSLNTCVQVRESHEGYDQSDCSQLSDGGTTMPPPNPRAYVSKLPYGPNDTRTGRFLADDRVDLITPSQPLHIAMDNPITLWLRGPAVARIDCHSLLGDVPCEAWKGGWSRKGMIFQQNADSTATVSLFPMGFGKHEFTFFILFVDGGVALKRLTVETDAGSVRPTSIGQSCDRETPQKDLPLGLVPPKNGSADFRGKISLIPWVCYDGVRGFVTPPATAVKYQVRTEGKDSPIELDPATGTAKAIRPGQALVQQTFAGLTSDTCVVVAPIEEPNASNCRQLRVKYGTPLPPLKFRVELPVTADAPKHPEPGRLGGIAPTIELAGKSPPLPAVDAITGARLSPQVRDRFNADDRLTVPTAGMVAELGQPTRLPVHLTGPPILSVTIEQELVQYNPRLGAVPYEDPAYMEEENANRIGRSADGSPYLHLLPLRTGSAEFHIALLFADGGVATRTVSLPVRLPAGIRPHLVNDLDDSIHDPQLEAATLHLTAYPPSSRNLFPSLVFDGRRSHIALDPVQVEYSLKSAGTDPVVRFDAKAGTVTALRVGHALLKARYAGVESDTCVVVVDDLTEGDASNCEELRAPHPSSGQP